MDPRLIVIIAGLFVALCGYVCLAPEQFGFLRLPEGFASLGMERIVTGVALMLLGFIGALSEIQGGAKRGRIRPFAFGDGLALAGAEPRASTTAPPTPLILDAEPDALPAVPERHTETESSNAGDASEAPPEP